MKAAQTLPQLYRYDSVSFLGRTQAMKRFLSLVLFSVGTLTGCEQAKQFNDAHTASATAAPPVPAVPTLAQQEECGRDAGRYVNDTIGRRHPVNVTYTYTDHYNAALGRCFVEVQQNITWKGRTSPFFELHDANEGTLLGRYNGYREPPDCWVKVVSGGQSSCTSSDMFDTLVKDYYGVSP
jgi:hypothetical protein